MNIYNSAIGDKCSSYFANGVAQECSRRLLQTLAVNGVDVLAVRLDDLAQMLGLLQLDVESKVSRFEDALHHVIVETANKVQQPGAQQLQPVLTSVQAQLFVQIPTVTGAFHFCNCKIFE